MKKIVGYRVVYTSFGVDDHGKELKNIWRGEVFHSKQSAITAVKTQQRWYHNYQSEVEEVYECTN